LSLPALFGSTAALQQAFADGLHRMLREHDGLGVYILALANAANEPELWSRLRAPLTERHHHHAARITSALRQGRPVNEPEDDLLVFLKLLALGFEHLRLTEYRQAGPWEIQDNPLRALRPARASAARIEGLRQPFNPEGFHFDKPFLAREILWQGELLGAQVALFYNKFPFAPLHGLLVPEKGSGLPQFLTPHWHDYAWSLTEALGDALPGFGLAYNSLGACASVNHLHFQSFVRRTPLPLSAHAWRHNGGPQPYPVAGYRFEDKREAWACLADLHQGQTAYNLIYLPGRLHVLPRRPQGDYRPAAWAGNHAWYELAGGVISFNRLDYERLQAEDIEAELRRLALS